MIEQLTQSRRTANSRYDPVKKCYISYRVDVRAGGKRYRNKFATKREAETFIERVKAKHREERAGLSTRSDVRCTELFAKHCAAIRNTKEQIRFRRVSGDFLSIIGYDPRVADVTRQMFLAYVAARQNVKPETVNRELTSLSAAFKRAEQYFPSLDGFNVKIPRAKSRKTHQYKRVITEAEMIAICNAIRTGRTWKEHQQRTEAREPFARMFEFAWMLGLRFGEVRSLTIEDYQDGILHVRRPKTGIVTPLAHIPPRAVELLREGFHTPTSDHTLTAILKDACKAVGIPYGRDTTGGITFHNTRHGFTTRLIAVTDLATARSFTGHSDNQMVAYYSHATAESQRAAMEALYGGDDLRKIYDKIRSNEMDFETFKRLCKLH